MRVSKKIVFMVCFCLLILSGVQRSGFAEKSPEVILQDALAPYFAGYTVGTFVLYDEAKRQYIIYNEKQSNKPLSPCSTFKIFHALIGLETGALAQADADTFQQWDGIQREIPAWNQDQTLATAIKGSVVWYFQDLALRIGQEPMKAYLHKIGYGNQDLSGGLTTFWLSSSLQISAREQVDLLHKLYAEELPVSHENAEIVKKDITISEEHGVKFMGKTGSSGGGKLGWFVGCVEKDGNRYFFAVNIEAETGADGLKARKISREILENIGVLNLK